MKSSNGGFDMPYSANVIIDESARLYGNNTIGENSQIMENVMLGYPDRDILSKIKEEGLRIKDFEFQGTIIGKNAIIKLPKELIKILKY